MSLRDFKMPSLKDKIEAQAEEVKEKLEKMDDENKKVIKKSAKKD